MALAAGEVIVPINAKLYYNSATYATPTWVEMDIVRDVSLGITKGETTIQIRGKGWDIAKGNFKNANIQVTVQHVVSNTSLAAINTAYFGNTEMDIAVMSGAITDVLAEGLRAVCEVFDFSRNEQLTESLHHNVVFKPSNLTNEPAWMNGA